ncbi:MAG: hypothetical protein KME11_15650 [Timaviella obliquedivisa GSE-PSE-MK23-08B]|nr:hypothetical protein [Timaviella obliquedivisa GSE-PSE-MK23-08B]
MLKAIVVCGFVGVRLSFCKIVIGRSLQNPTLQEISGCFRLECQQEPRLYRCHQERSRLTTQISGGKQSLTQHQRLLTVRYL